MINAIRPDSVDSHNANANLCYNHAYLGFWRPIMQTREQLISQIASCYRDNPAQAALLIKDGLWMRGAEGHLFSNFFKNKQYQEDSRFSDFNPINILKEFSPFELKSYGKAFSKEIEDYINFKDKYGTEPWTALDVSPNAAKRELLNKRNEVNKQFHPDRMQSVRGERASKANEAYILMTKHREYIDLLNNTPQAAASSSSSASSSRQSSRQPASKSTAEAASSSNHNQASAKKTIYTARQMLSQLNSILGSNIGIEDKNIFLMHAVQEEYGDLYAKLSDIIQVLDNKLVLPTEHQLEQFKKSSPETWQHLQHAIENYKQRFKLIPEEGKLLIDILRYVVTNKKYDLLRPSEKNSINFRDDKEINALIDMVEDNVSEQKILDKIVKNPPALGRKLIIAMGSSIPEPRNAHQHAAQSSSQRSSASSSSSHSSRFFNQVSPQKIVDELFQALKNDRKSAIDIQGLYSSSTKIQTLLDIASNADKQEDYSSFNRYPMIHSIYKGDMLKLQEIGKRILDDIFNPILKKHGVTESFKELCTKKEYASHIEQKKGGRWSLMVTDAKAGSELFSDDKISFYQKMRR